MKLHANARTCPHSRRLVVDRVAREGWTLGDGGPAGPEVADHASSSRSPVKDLEEEHGGRAHDGSSKLGAISSRNPTERTHAATVALLLV
jgi:hypothetical protein